MNLHLVPATRMNLETSIEKAVDINIARKYLDEKFILQLIEKAGSEGIRCWAVTKSRKKLHEDMLPGDEVLLSEKRSGLFTHYGQVIAKTENKEFGKALWPIAGDNPWEYIYFLNNIRETKINKRKLVTDLGYKDTYTVPGSVRVRDESYKEFGYVGQKIENGKLA